MGSGKTRWAIQFICESKNANFLYITPFLNECNRIIEKTKDGINLSHERFKQPLHKGNGKLDSLNELLQCQQDIASTHQLFRYIDDDTKKYIKENNYILILDEVLSVVESYPLSKDDLQILKDSNCISIDEDGFLIWNPDKKDYDTAYNEIKSLTETKSLLCINDKFVIWRYPPEIFKMFSKVYVLTYLFDASILRYYFNLNKIPYKKRV